MQDLTPVPLHPARRRPPLRQHRGIDARSLAIVTPGILGPDYFRELAAVVDAAARRPARPRRDRSGDAPARAHPGAVNTGRGSHFHELDVGACADARIALSGRRFRGDAGTPRVVRSPARTVSRAGKGVRVGLADDARRPRVACRGHAGALRRICGHSAPDTVGPSTAAPTGEFCDGVYSSGKTPDVRVPAGVVCVLPPGTEIKRDVRVEAGGALIADRAAIGRDIVAEGHRTVLLSGGSVGHDLRIDALSGAGQSGGVIMICGVDVGHDLTLRHVQTSAGTVAVGGVTPCSGNTVGHDLIVTDNGSALVSLNTAGHDAICQGNAELSGGLNRARHANSCPSSKLAQTIEFASRSPSRRRSAARPTPRQRPRPLGSKWRSRLTRRAVAAPSRAGSSASPGVGTCVLDANQPEDGGFRAGAAGATADTGHRPGALRRLTLGVPSFELSLDGRLRVRYRHACNSDESSASINVAFPPFPQPSLYCSAKINNALGHLVFIHFHTDTLFTSGQPYRFRRIRSRSTSE